MGGPPGVNAGEGGFGAPSRSLLCNALLCKVLVAGHAEFKRPMEMRQSNLGCCNRTPFWLNRACLGVGMAVCWVVPQYVGCYTCRMLMVCCWYQGVGEAGAGLRHSIARSLAARGVPVAVAGEHPRIWLAFCQINVLKLPREGAMAAHGRMHKVEPKCKRLPCISDVAWTGFRPPGVLDLAVLALDGAACSRCRHAC